MAPAKMREFILNEVIQIKGYYFKIVLIDGYTGKIALKCITPEEAKMLESKAGDRS